MSVGWIDGMRNRANTFVEAATVFVERTANREPVPSDPGRDAVRWLVTQIESFAESDAHDDDGFIEGAGAFLGLVLIHHFKGHYRRRRHDHRIQIGRYGFFDPFDAVGHALDAEDPRSALADRLRIAESEARGEGPVSRAVDAFERALRELRPDIQITDQFELEVSLSDETSVDLGRVARASDTKDSASLDASARRMVSLLPGSEAPTTIGWDEAAERLVPRIVPESFLARLPQPGALFAQPLKSNLHIALQLRYDGRSRYVRQQEVAAWVHAVTGAHPISRALDNLARLSAPWRTEPFELEGVEARRVRYGDGLDSSRLLLPDLFSRLRKEVAPPIIAVAPHRDAFVFCSLTEPSLKALVGHALDQSERAPHPVSSDVFELTAQGLRPHSVRPPAMHG